MKLKGAYTVVSSDEERSDSISRSNVIASKAPQAGTSMGAAYFATLAAGRHNSMRTNLDTSGIQTERMAARAAEARAEQALLQGSYTMTHIIKNTGFESKASFYEAIGKYSGNTISLSQNIKGAFPTVGSKAVGGAQGAFSSHDDMGTQLAGGTITAGTAAYIGIRAMQTASPHVINAVQGLPTTVRKTASGIIAAAQVQNNIAHMKTTIISTTRGIQTGIVTATNAVKRSYTLVRGMVNGTIMSAVVAHVALMKASALAKGVGLKGLKFVGQGVARGAVKSEIWAMKSGIPKATHGIGGLSMGIARALSSSNDMMLTGVGKTIMLTNYGIKTSIVAGRMTGRVVKTSIKGTIGAVKGTYNAINFVRQKGLRAAWNRARNKAKSAVVKAGKSVVSAVLNLVKALGQKIIVPILLIAIFASVIMSIFSAPVVAIGGIFSGLFDRDNGDGTYTETDIRAFITDATSGVPAKRTAYINDLADYMSGQLEANGGGYDYVRFKTNTQDNVIEPTVAGITSVFYTEEDLANIIQPIFNAVILQKYELAPTDTESKEIFTEIFNKLFRRNEAATIEYCGQSAIDGTGTPSTHSCGSIHAFADCPNHVTGTHGSYTCSGCCYYNCPGHEHTDSGGNEYTTYCSGCEHACSGYDYCGGHDVLIVTLNMDGLYQLLNEYFEQPIDTLSNMASRTEEQENELQNLKDSYEICLEYIKQVTQDYGGGLTMEDLSGVNFINGSRVGNQAVIDLALSQVGQVGGQPYWSWYGFSSRVEWCATFVSWCMNQTGHSEVKYASCQYGGVPYFQGMGRWASGGYTDLVAGDVIFFDWDGDGKAQHTGLVIGTDGEYVYTVEGNSGDICRTKKYVINSSVIMGYGLMNY